MCMRKSHPQVREHCQRDITTASLARRFKRSDSTPNGDGDALFASVALETLHCLASSPAVRGSTRALENGPAMSAPRTCDRLAIGFS